MAILMVTLVLGQETPSTFYACEKAGAIVNGAVVVNKQPACKAGATNDESGQEWGIAAFTICVDAPS